MQCTVTHAYLYVCRLRRTCICAHVHLQACACAYIHACRCLSWVVDHACTCQWRIGTEERNQPASQPARARACAAALPDTQLIVARACSFVQSQSLSAVAVRMARTGKRLAHDALPCNRIPSMHACCRDYWTIITCATNTNLLPLWCRTCRIRCPATAVPVRLSRSSKACPASSSRGT